MTTYGFCRISTPKQSIDRQIRNIKALFPNAVIVEEVYTGTAVTGRKKWEALRHAVKPGDRIVFDSVSRMSRNAAEGFAVYQELFAAGVELSFIKEPHIDTKVYQEALDRQIKAQADSGDSATDELIAGIAAALNRYMMRLAQRQIELAFEQAEKEVSDLHQRTKEGIQTAKLHGKQIGQRQGAKLVTKKSIAAKAEILKHSKAFGGSLSDVDCIRLIGIARNTYFKYKRELLQEGIAQTR